MFVIIKKKRLNFGRIAKNPNCIQCLQFYIVTIYAKFDHLFTNYNSRFYILMSNFRRTFSNSRPTNMVVLQMEQVALTFRPANLCFSTFMCSWTGWRSIARTNRSESIPRGNCCSKLPRKQNIGIMRKNLGRIPYW